MKRHTLSSVVLSAESSRPDLLGAATVRDYAGASVLDAYWACLWRDAAFHGVVGAYGLAALLVANAVGVPHKLAPLTYVRPLAAMVPIVLWLILVVLAVQSLASRHPLQDLRYRVLRVFNPHITAGLLLFASLSVFIGIFSSLKTMLTDVVPFFADAYLADLDRMLHFGRDPWVFTTLPPVLTNAIELVYAGVWGVLLTASMLAVLLVPKLRAVRRQYVWTFLITWPLLGNLCAGLVLSAGPTYYELVTGDGRFGALTQFLSENSILQKHARQFLWTAYLRGEVIAGAGISAFPSMHVATSTLLALLAARVNRLWAWAGLLFLALIQFGSVHLGWHYAIDGYFSVVVTVLVWVAVRPKGSRSRGGLLSLKLSSSKSGSRSAQ